jgi:hypothetical protein
MARVFSSVNRPHSLECGLKMVALAPPRFRSKRASSSDFGLRARLGCALSGHGHNLKMTTSRALARREWFVPGAEAETASSLRGFQMTARPLLADPWRGRQKLVDMSGDAVGGVERSAMPSRQRGKRRLLREQRCGYVACSVSSRAAHRQAPRRTARHPDVRPRWPSPAPPQKGDTRPDCTATSA